MTEQMTRPAATAPNARRLPLPVPRNAQGTLPLSSLQEQLWFLDRLAPGMRAYNVSRAFRVTGPPGRAARAPAPVRRLRRLAAAPDREPRVPAAPRLLGRAPARSPAARVADRPAAADGAQLRERLRRGRHRAGGAGRPPRPGGA